MNKNFWIFITSKETKKEAFTLAETLITVVILGILAAILVPNLIKNQVENANRTKVKKAMAVYEKAINYMIIENDIKETESLRELGQDNCKYTREYFKTVQDGVNNCIFKTADRVWWDITDITNPVISLKDEITDSNEGIIAANALSLNADTTSFALIGRFDDLGTLRVNDNAYEQGLNNNLTNQAYMIKLWHFINNNEVFSSKEQFVTCDARGLTTCKITLNGESVTYSKITTDSDITIDKDYNGNQLCILGNCEYSSAAPKGEYWISDNIGIPLEAEAKDRTGSICTATAKCLENGDYWNASMRKCKNLGGHLANLAELEIARNNGKLTSGSYWANEQYMTFLSYYMNSNGDIRANHKYVSNYQIICVGE